MAYNIQDCSWTLSNGWHTIQNRTFRQRYVSVLRWKYWELHNQLSPAERATLSTSPLTLPNFVLYISKLCDSVIPKMYLNTSKLCALVLQNDVSKYLQMLYLNTPKWCALVLAHFASIFSNAVRWYSQIKWLNTPRECLNTSECTLIF